MKDYMKPELEVVDFYAESITDEEHGPTGSGEGNDDSGL